MLSLNFSVIILTYDQTFKNNTNTLLMQWTHKQLPDQEILALSESLNISKTLASLLLRLGISTPHQAQRFLYPRLAHLQDPYELTNMDRAVKRTLTAIKKQESVTILGDYDVDGITSTTLLTFVLKTFGLNPHFVTPLRLEEGYGMTQAVLERVLSGPSPSLLFALDCGTNSNLEVSFLKNKGIDVIIIDHHQSNEPIPEDTILINPHVYDAPNAPWANLCTVGLVFKFTHALIKSFKESDHPKANMIDLKELLDLVALGTIADLVPLLEENRILTSFGLLKIQNSTRPGIQALNKISGVNQSQPLRPSDVSFRLGPRINASGRLSDAALPVNMLLAEDFQKCALAAEQLNAMNQERQEIERAVTTHAMQLVESEGLAEQNAIISFFPGWHSGVVGIVAGKLSRLHNRPTFILTKEGNSAKGSGRSIPGINLITALSECSDLLESWGGHPMAAGITMNPDKIKEFTVQFNKALSSQIKGLTYCEPLLEISGYLNPEDLTEGLLEEIELLHPFGMSNPEPIFGILNAILPNMPSIFANDHFRFQVKKRAGMPLNGIAWNMANNLPPHNLPITLAVKFSYNYWNGRKTPQLELIDWKHPQN